MTIRLFVLTCLTACHMGGGGGSRSNIEPSKNELELAARPLTASEQDKLAQNGLVILGNGRTQSFHVGYVALFHANQPVFISADSLLYAWHSSYDKILTALEYQALVPAVDSMLDELRDALAKSDADAQTRADLDVYLAVAASLAKGQLQPPVAGGDATQIGAVFERGQAAEGLGMELFGASYKFDFSMLRPRGHYANDPTLQRYFRVMSWLGRAEIQIATKQPAQPWHINRRALRAAHLLGSLFTDKTRAHWQTIDSTIGALVGPADSMSLPGLASALAQLGPGADTLPDDKLVAAFAEPAAQKIRTQLQHAGERSIAFVLLGQRYLFDAGVFSDLTYGSLDTEPPRLMPTPLDVAYVALHNQTARALLAPEVAKYGTPYEQALARDAARPLPTDSVTNLWLAALRELSPDAKRDAELPAPLTSDAWGRRIAATQLASWAELRHDNLLYAKQSFTAELGCEFPDAYIDPYPAFYARMEQMAKRARDAITSLPTRPSAESHLLHYFDGMATTMARLRAIAERERANQPLTAGDLDFINHMVSLDAHSVVCAVTTDPKGWYAELFWDQKSALWHDPVIADVHTQPTDEAGNQVGRVLHVGTGAPRMMALTIRHDQGAHTQTYRGFVSTYAEVITENFKRMTDEEWRHEIHERMIGTPAWLEPIIAR
jgi:hypothetical protein